VLLAAGIAVNDPSLGFYSEFDANMKDIWAAPIRAMLQNSDCIGGFLVATIASSRMFKKTQ
jgi:hypothetical protein